MSQLNMRSTIKNGKSKMYQIIWDGLKWNIGSNYVGRREYKLKIMIWTIKKCQQIKKTLIGKCGELQITYKMFHQCFN